MTVARRGIVTLWPPLAAFFVLLAIWEAYARLVLGATPASERLLPAPTRIVEKLAANAGIIAPHAAQTALETALGFTLALLAGIGFALVMEWSDLARRAIYPLLVVSQTIPITSIAPLLVLWFSYGLLPKVLVVGLVCFFPIVVAGADGLRSTEPDLIRLFRTFGASPWTILRRARFPNALPSLFSGIRIASTYAVTGAIWGEYVGADEGLGIYMRRNQNVGETALVFSAILVIAVLSMALFLLVTLVERLLIPWHFAGRTGKK